MSDTKDELKPVCYIQNLENQIASFKIQREQAQSTYQQLTGAIFACEMLLKQEQEKIEKHLMEQAKNQGAIENGKAKSKGTEQAA